MRAGRKIAIAKDISKARDIATHACYPVGVIPVAAEYDRENIDEYVANNYSELKALVTSGNFNVLITDAE